MGEEKQRIKKMKRIKVDFDSVTRMDDLLSADFTVRDKKDYTASMRKWDANWQTNFQLLYDDLQNETYVPGAVKIDKRKTRGGKMRNVSLFSHRDNIVCEMIVQAISPIFASRLITRTFGNIKGRGPLKCQNQLIKDVAKVKDPYFLWMDVTKFYESVDWRVMYNSIARKVKGAKFLRLVHTLLSTHGCLPIGGRHCQLFGNIILSELDRYILHTLNLKHYVRYCDDMILLHSDKKVLHTAKRDVESFLTNKKLDLNRSWTVRPVDAQGIDFLGSVVFTHDIRLRTATKKRHERRLSALNRKAQPDIKEDRYIASLNGILSHRNTKGLIKYWRKRYEYVFERHERRQAARAVANEEKRKRKLLEAELQRCGDIWDGLIGREWDGSIRM